MRTLPFLLIIIFVASLNAQTSVDHFRKSTDSTKSKEKAKYFCDLHAHVTLKNYNRQVFKAGSFAKGENIPTLNFKDCRTKYEKGSKDANFKNFDQCHFSQLLEGKFDIVITSISPLERNCIVNTKGKKGRVKFIATKSASKLHKSKINSLVHENSFDELKAEMKFLNQAVNFYNEDFIIAPNFNALAKNNDKTKIILSIEGGHSLFGNLKSTDVLNKNSKSSEDSSINYLDNVVANINWLKDSTSVFFITLEHLWWNKIAGQSKALHKPKKARILNWASKSPILNKLMFNKHGSGIYTYRTERNKNIAAIDTNCIPKLESKKRYDNGITDEITKNPFGSVIIKELLNQKNGKRPIYIDLRHADVKTRLDYYLIIDSLKKNHNIQIPIIFSHAAVSGKNLKVAHLTNNRPHFDRYQELSNRNYFYDNQKIRFPAYNCALKEDYPFFWQKCNYPSSTSKLCYAKKEKCFNVHNQHEHDVDNRKLDYFFSWSINLFDEEIKWIYESNGIIGLMAEERLLGAYSPSYITSQKNLANFLALNYKYSKEQIEEFIEIAPLIRNLFYIIDHSGKNDSSAWNNVCFSTDFDGLTDPLDNCLTSADVPALYELLTKNKGEVFEIYCRFNNCDENKYFKNRGISVQESMDKFFRYNMINFLSTYFK